MYLVAHIVKNAIAVSNCCELLTSEENVVISIDDDRMSSSVDVIYDVVYEHSTKYSCVLRNLLVFICQFSDTKVKTGVKKYHIKLICLQDIKLTTP